MQCSNCGAKAVAGTKFCTHCGAKIDPTTGGSPMAGNKPMTDQEWYELCAANWELEAGKLRDEGWTVVREKPFEVFEKDGSRCYLARNLGSSEWERSARFLWDWLDN